MARCGGRSPTSTAPSRGWWATGVRGRSRRPRPRPGDARGLIGVDVPGHGEMWVTLANIHGAKLVMTDKLIAATAPLSAEGADQIVEIEEEDGSRPADDELDSKVEGQD